MNENFHNYIDSAWICRLHRINVDDQSDDAKNSLLGLFYVRDITSSKLCLDAVKKDGYDLEWVKNQSRSLCYIAVEQDLSVARFIRSGKMKMEILSDILNLDNKDIKSVAIPTVGFYGKPRFV